MLAQSSDGLEILRLWDETGDSFELKIPKSPAGESELALELQVLKALKPFSDKLPFSISEYVGQTKDFDGTKAILFTLLGGNQPDLAKLGPGNFSRTFAEAIAAIHSLPLGAIRDAGLPEYDSSSILHSKVTELDRVAASGRIPAILLSRWEAALEDVGLFRFHPATTHGAISSETALVDGQNVVAIGGWGNVSIADPAEDFRWLAGGGLPSTFDDAMIHYRSIRSGADENIAQRATLYSELELATWLIHCAKSGDEAATKQAEDMIEDLRSHLEAGNLRALTASSFVGLAATTTLLSEITSSQAVVTEEASIDSAEEVDVFEEIFETNESEMAPDDAEFLDSDSGQSEPNSETSPDELF